ncbi:hypothetical protein [uncultured Mycobacterium sp.]|uniref:hypothetical protein n=1 Tax=uncultured Mycobacterium sp. TaxID=171292 RepID=UPI0035CA02BE
MMSEIPVAASGSHLPMSARLLTFAQLGYAHWLFGNMYEAVVNVPERLASEPSRPSVLGRGSPLRYYAPVAPITLAATASAVGTGWEMGGARRWLAMTVGCEIWGLAITGYLIRTVNLKVIFARVSPPRAERDALLRRWYRLNLVRMAAAGGALFAAHRANRAITTGIARRSA